ncbi:hypothetical protein [Brevibacillus porteri]|uniref:hypothetical protein n=1 Tax=Brevibacillus porteri TaxID=2126350 RepID=UPI0011B1EF0C|nr:hypothetical protein [Brevibacillus porteri]MED1802989.1 hypothetical protein [Brevibacillus porteri]MED2134651.1 hypothetical protein [Brevibacillus porteri]MED2748170.1 hypothetical protein [Brevibacillus porteri]MED2817493.1 hypothetical protein [Brevibacillus porteri]MED2897801.1 hypothetical protein [Brevibacillus porteri]
MDVQRGQFITSIRKLCEKWGWSKTKVTQFLKMLESDEMIVYFSDTKKTVITIGKYGFYQAGEDSEKTEEGHVEDTEETRKSTNKNDKETKKEIYTPQFDEFWSVYPRKLSKADAAKAWNALIKSGASIDEIMTATRNYTDECHGKEVQFIKHAATFLKNDRWKDHLLLDKLSNYKAKKADPRDKEIQFQQWLQQGRSPEEFNWGDS